MPDPRHFLATLVATMLLAGTAGAAPAPLAAALPEQPDFVCQVIASETVQLGAEVPGVIDQIMVHRGEQVSAGEKVAELRDHLQRVELQLAEAAAADTTTLRARQAKLAYANRKLARNAGLVRGNMISANEMDQMRTERDVAADEVAAAIEAHKLAELQVAKARVELAMRTIRSPVTGVVTERNLAPGDLVRDQPILVVQQIDPLHVEITLPMGMMGKVVKGTPAHIVVESPGEPTITAPVSMTDPVVDAASNTFIARVVLSNPHQAIPAGSKCRARFDLP